MAGAALAINLVYLSLERFRYHRAIRTYATREVDKFDAKYTIPNPGSSAMYRQVKHFAELQDNAPEPPLWKIWKLRARKAKPDAFPWPDENPAKTYVRLFACHNDIRWAVAMAFIAGVLLVLGVAHSIDHVQFINCVFDPTIILGPFYVLLACMIFPVVFVVKGDKVVRWANKKIDENLEELKGLCLKKEAQTAVPPPPAA